MLRTPAPLNGALGCAVKSVVQIAVCFLLAGCLPIMNGLVRNESDQEVFHLTEWKPFEEPIPRGEARKLRLSYPGACIELIVGGKHRYYVVPEPPVSALLKGYWNATYAMKLDSQGLQYVGTDGSSMPFSQVASCLQAQTDAR